MKTPDQIVAELAGIRLRDLDPLEPGPKETQAGLIFEKIRRLVLSARAARDSAGPVTHAPDKAERADDYLAVVQIALGLGRDGRLYTHHRHDSPKEAVVPLAAALRHIVNQIERDLRGQIGLGKGDFNDLCVVIVRGMEAEDFKNIRLEIADASRTQQAPKIIVPT